MAGEYLFDGKDKLKSGQIYGLKLSYNIIGSQMLDSLGIDAIAGYIDTTSTTDNSKAKVYHFRLDATYPFIFKNSNFTPFLAVGAGANLYERSDASEGKALVGYGGGLKYKLLDYLAVRADVRHILIVTPERRDNVEFTAGLTYTFGVERKPKPEESEKDKKEKDKKEKEKIEKEKIEKEKIEKEKIENDHKAKEGKKGKTPAKPEKIGDSSAVAKAETGSGKGPGEKSPEIGRKPKGQESPTSAKAEAVPAAEVPSAPAPAAPAAAPVEASPAPAAAREVSPESKALQPATPAETKAAATTPAGESAREITAPVAGAPSKPVPPAPAIVPVEAAPAPVEKKAAKTAAEPAVPPPAYNAPPEEKRQLPEQPGKVSPETPAVVPTEGEAALTAIAGTGDGVEIRTSGPVVTFRHFRMSKPARLVIDLPGTSNGTGKETFSLGRFGLAGARVSTYRGKLRIVLDAEGRTFPRFRVEKSATGLRVALVEAAPPAQEAAPAPAETKQEYLLRFTIEFDSAKAVIRPKYYAMMRKAAEFLLSNPATVAEIRGHTDSIGKARYNVLLSQRRAGSVRKFFAKKYGVDGSRIIVRGYGYYFPIADNATAAGRQKNRRTEVTIAIRKGGATPKPGTEGGRAPAPVGGEPR